MKRIDINDLRTIQIQILKEVDLICRENNIKYFLSGGTLLGAIRHDGYIPWDDDIDIELFRPEYERLIQAFENRSEGSKVHIITSKNNPNHIWPFAKVIHKDTVQYEAGVELGVNIDIFPLDSLFDDKQRCEKFIKRVGFIRKLLYIKLMKISKNRAAIKNVILALLKVLLAPFSTIYFVRKIEHILRKPRKEDSKYVAAVVGAWGSREIILRNSMDETIPHKFEDGEYPIPVGYDHILTSLYGAYMELPPIEKRKSHHSFEAYWKE